MSPTPLPPPAPPAKANRRHASAIGGIVALLATLAVQLAAGLTDVAEDVAPDDPSSAVWLGGAAFGVNWLLRTFRPAPDYSRRVDPNGAG